MTAQTRPTTSGIHHVTAICGDARRNIRFHAGLLGLRLVKKTVNYDDPGTYHLYYGDGVGSPGTIITFFAWTHHAPLADNRGTRGSGQILATALAIPRGSLDYWIGRLATAGVSFDGPETRFGEQVIAFDDPDGVRIELVESDVEAAPAPWSAASVESAHAIRRLRGVSLSVVGEARTASFLTETMGFTAGGAEQTRHRFAIADAVVDLVVTPGLRRGSMGRGIAHHVAWRARTGEEQLAWRELLQRDGRDVTEVLDRTYFTSIYLHEPNGVVFEIATDGPGFTADEPAAELGTALKLPAWLEPRRAAIEARLAPV